MAAAEPRFDRRSRRPAGQLVRRALGGVKLAGWLDRFAAGECAVAARPLGDVSRQSRPQRGKRRRRPVAESPLARFRCRRSPGRRSTAPVAGGLPGARLPGYAGTASAGRQRHGPDAYLPEPSGGRFRYRSPAMAGADRRFDRRRCRQLGGQRRVAAFGAVGQFAAFAHVGRRHLRHTQQRRPLCLSRSKV